MAADVWWPISENQLPETKESPISENKVKIHNQIEDEKKQPQPSVDEEIDESVNKVTGEYGSPRGPEPTRYSAWEKNIFTNSDRIHAIKALDRLGIRDCFEKIICFETMNPNLMKSNRPDEFPVVLKPSIEAMNIAVEAAEVDPRRMLFFYDNVKNVAAGKVVGLRTVLIFCLTLMAICRHLFEEIYRTKDSYLKAIGYTEENGRIGSTDDYSDMIFYAGKFVAIVGSLMLASFFVLSFTLTQIMMLSSGDLPGTDIKPVVQLAELRLVNTSNLNNERYRVLNSDGVFMQQGMLATQHNELVRSERLQKGSIVQLKQFVCNLIQNRRSVTRAS
ncbi:hypothetical protein CASFOL_025545 [Castilleja foliolosa]|uniref:Replication factor-A protein 1 N-terminal domain-containing protein n=1 Tax=Castilleja foliolosa TaxID=1961234 RepID=A0ABD3CUM7_9LAMI